MRAPRRSMSARRPPYLPCEAKVEGALTTRYEGRARLPTPSLQRGVD